ncbi:MAG: ABC transporter ATP-binding protein [Thermoproteales archaeon]|nr:ABC transporter ATP-binding protein [Thermoproteales archaeon]
MSWCVEIEGLYKIYETFSPGKRIYFKDDNAPTHFISVIYWSLLGKRVFKEVLRDITLRVRVGEIFGILGPNGSGKTTLLRVLAGLTPPTKGKIRVFGKEVDWHQLYKFMNYIPGALAGGGWMLHTLSAYENLKIRARLLNVPEERVKEVMDFLGITEFGDKPVGTYSSGMLARLEVAAALLKDAPIILLDEPTAGFSPEIEREFHEHLKKFAKNEGKTIIYATHMLHFAETFFDRIAILKQGEIMDIGRPQELKEKLGTSSTIEIIIIPKKSTAIAALKDKFKSRLDKLFAIEHVSEHKYRLRVSCRETEETLMKLIPTVIESGFLIRHIIIREPTLEDYYLSLVER